MENTIILSLMLPICRVNMCVCMAIPLCRVKSSACLRHWWYLNVLTTYPHYQGCIDWSKSTSIKKLHHFSIRENTVREAVQHYKIDLKHHPDIRNPTYMFTDHSRENIRTNHTSLPSENALLSLAWVGSVEHRRSFRANPTDFPHLTSRFFFPTLSLEEGASGSS
jgi:hypothetical protein